MRAVFSAGKFIAFARGELARRLERCWRILDRRSREYGEFSKFLQDVRCYRAPLSCSCVPPRLVLHYPPTGRTLDVEAGERFHCQCEPRERLVGEFALRNPR